MLESRKITWTLSVGHALSSTSFLAAATVTSIIGADLSGRTEWAGVPSAVYLLGAALSSLILGYAMDRLGRRQALSVAYAVGACGAAIAIWAGIARTFAGFVCGLALMGPASAAASLSRFVAAEVHPADQRGRAIAIVVVGGTAGTIIWPALSLSLGPWLASSRTGGLVWPFAISLALLAVASLVIATFLRPDPRDLARTLANQDPHAARERTRTSLREIVTRPGAVIAVCSMVIAHAVMVMVMVITSLHMRNHHHEVGAIAMTTSLHTLGMFAFSIVSGKLSDSVGRAPVIMTGAVALIVACLVAGISPAFAPITAGLFLLGLGWNFCFVGGSSLLADQLSADERARTQGFNDLLMGLVAASGSFLSGHVFAAVGYATMGLVSAVLSLMPLGLAFWWLVTRPRQQPAGA